MRCLLCCVLEGGLLHGEDVMMLRGLLPLRSAAEGDCGESFFAASLLHCELCMSRALGGCACLP